MNKVFEDILAKYTAGELTAEETNKQLKEAGANFSIDPFKATDGWTEAEMREGFIPADPSEKKEVLRHGQLPRRKDLAGQTVVQTIEGRHYYVTYDERGYVYKEVKVNKD